MVKELFSLHKRSYELEILDKEDRGYEETAEAYRLIRRVNRYLGGTRVILSHLKKFCRDLPKDQMIRILDIATGASDIPQAIASWARKEGRNVQVVALDLNPKVVDFARTEVRSYPEIQLLQACTFHLPFPPESFDYVISSMFFHHLSEEKVIQLLRLFDGMARRGIIINDLLRRKRAYLWILFFSRFTRNAIFRGDAPLSVLKGYQKEEMENILKEAGLSYLKFHEHFGHRFALAGEKA